MLLHLKYNCVLKMTVISFPKRFCAPLYLFRNFMIFLSLQSECESYKCLPPCLAFTYKTFLKIRILKFVPPYYLWETSYKAIKYQNWYYHWNKLLQNLFKFSVSSFTFYNKISLLRISYTNTMKCEHIHPHSHFRLLPHPLPNMFPPSFIRPSFSFCFW